MANGENLGEKISHDMVILAEAYGLHIKTLGKYWALAATVAVLAVTVDTGSDDIKVLGFKLLKQNFYQACAAFGAVLNFAYVISHLQSYRAGEVFRSYLESIDAETNSITPRFSLMDAGHLLYPSAFNRVYPIRHFLPSAIGDNLIKLIKLPIDLFIFLVPISGCTYAMIKLWTPHWGAIEWVVAALVTVSTLFTLVLVVHGLRWLVQGDPHANKDHRIEVNNESSDSSQ